MNTPDDPLDELLTHWQVRGDTPPTFQREVWARIAAQEAEPTWKEKLCTRLLKPSSWLVASAVAILIGAGVAWLETRPLQLTPYDAYVRSISPFASHHLAAR